MPEIPELEAICRVLNSGVAGSSVVSAQVRIPVVIRLPASQDAFVRLLKENTFQSFERRGKFVLGWLASGHVLAVNQMLTGRLQLCPAGEKFRARTCWVISFTNGQDLRYFGQLMDGRVYLVPKDGLNAVPGVKEAELDALSPSMTLEMFLQRLGRYSGQIKNVLTQEKVVTGIGNAYADEILFEAGIYPFKSAKALTIEERQRLYRAIGEVFRWAIPIVQQRMGATVDERVRDFLRVHRKGGQPCPRCGTSITEVTPNQRITSYCRRCQSGLGFEKRALPGFSN